MLSFFEKSDNAVVVSRKSELPTTHDQFLTVKPSIAFSQYQSISKVNTHNFGNVVPDWSAGYVEVAWVQQSFEGLGPLFVATCHNFDVRVGHAGLQFNIV